MRWCPSSQQSAARTKKPHREQGASPLCSPLTQQMGNPGPEGCGDFPRLTGSRLEPRSPDCCLSALCTPPGAPPSPITRGPPETGNLFIVHCGPPVNRPTWVWCRWSSQIATVSSSHTEKGLGAWSSGFSCKVQKHCSPVRSPLQQRNGPLISLCHISCL